MLIEKAELTVKKALLNAWDVFPNRATDEIYPTGYVHIVWKLFLVGSIGGGESDLRHRVAHVPRLSHCTTFRSRNLDKHELL